MGYREHAPPPGLAGTVACTWLRTPDAGPEAVRVLPDGCSDVLWIQGRGVVVAGPDTTAQLSSADALIVGVRFRPGAGGAALGVPLHELRDLRVEAADVDPAYAVPADAAPEDALRALLAATAGRRADPLVTAAAAQVEEHDVRALARDLGVSERHLRRRFHAAVGYGPGTLARVRRFQRALAALDRGERLAAVALEAGYADQAHLTRECRRLAGVTPAALRRARGARPPAAGTAAPPTR